MASWGEGMTTIPKQDLPFAEASEGSATPKNPKIITCDVDGTIMRRLDPLGDSKPDTDLLDFLLDAKGAGAAGYHRVESHDGYERQDHENMWNHKRAFMDTILELAGFRTNKDYASLLEEMVPKQKLQEALGEKARVYLAFDDEGSVEDYAPGCTFHEQARDGHRMDLDLYRGMLKLPKRGDGLPSLAPSAK
jgi:hypothetical protein